MSQQHPETESSEAAENGTASHWVASEVLDSYKTDEGLITCGSLIGKTAPNSVIITEEMAEGADIYVKDVLSVAQDRGALQAMCVEQRIEAPRIHDLSYGTCDCYIFDRETGELFIWDYKFGYGVVEAFENWQSINYAAGIFDQFQVSGLEDQVTSVRIRIAQPRAFHREGPVREWVVKGDDLRGYFNQLHAGATKALGLDAECNSGTHCVHCPARHDCEAAITAGVQLFEAVSQPTPLAMSNEALGVQLSLVKRARKHLTDLESGIEEQVKYRMQSGDLIPGWLKQDTFGNLKWNKPFNDVIAMGQMMGANLQAEKTITPTQAIKLGVDESVIKAYSSKSQTGVKIIPDDGTEARKVFTHGTLITDLN